MPNSVEERFWSKVNVRGIQDCWIWQAGTFNTGYGCFNTRANGIKVTWTAHRFAYWLAYEELPEVIQHDCDTPLCVNFHHLTPGTHQSNVEDMVKKNRQAKGSYNGNSKLVEEQVREIRKLYKETDLTQGSIASQFHISRNQVSDIINRKVWKHLA